MINNSAYTLNIAAANVILKKIQLFSTSASSTNRIIVKGDRVVVKSVYINSAYPNPPTSNVVQNIARVTSQHGNIKTMDVKMFCSRYFYVEVLKTSNGDNTSTNVDFMCSTCGANEYALKNTLHIQNIIGKYFLCTNHAIVLPQIEMPK